MPCKTSPQVYRKAQINTWWNRKYICSIALVKICNWHLLQWLWRIRFGISQFRFCLTFSVGNSLALLKFIAALALCFNGCTGLFDQKVAAKLLHIFNCHISTITNISYEQINLEYFVEIHVKYFNSICKYYIILLGLCCFRNIIWKRANKGKGEFLP